MISLLFTLSALHCENWTNEWFFLSLNRRDVSAVPAVGLQTETRRRMRRRERKCADPAPRLIRRTLTRLIEPTIHFSSIHCIFRNCIPNSPFTALLSLSPPPKLSASHPRPTSTPCYFSLPDIPTT